MSALCRPRFVSIWLFVVVGLPTAAHTQSATQQPQYTFRRTVRRVVLDIVVTDKTHHPVHGLTSENFRVFEDKTQQHIRSFEELNFDAYPKLGAATLPPLPPGTYMNLPAQPERGPLYVIVLDEMHLFFGNDKHVHLEQQVWARQELKNFLAGKPAGTRFALFVLAQDFRMVQGFTADPKQLLSAFDVDREALHVPWVFLYAPNYGKDDAAVPYEVLAFIGHYLDGLPGRKNLIWISRGFPMFLPMFGLPNTQGGTKDAGGGYRPAPGTMGSSYDEKVMREAIDALDQAQVSIYPVDTGGVGEVDFGAEQVADATGGHAYVGSNDLLGSLKDAADNGASYYEISYAPSNANYDGRIRDIRVEASRGDYKLQYRRHYFADEPYVPLTNDEKATAAAESARFGTHKPGDSFFAWMQHGAPAARQLLFRARFSTGPIAMATPEQIASLEQQSAYFSPAKSAKSTRSASPVPVMNYTIDYVVLDRMAEVNAKGRALEFAACAYDKLGKMLSGISQQAVRPGPPRAGSQESGSYFRAEQNVEVPANAEWLRVGVRDLATDRVGTIEVHLPFPSGSSAPQ